MDLPIDPGDLPTITRCFVHQRGSATVTGIITAESGFASAWEGLQSSRACLARHPFGLGASLGLLVGLALPAGVGGLHD